MPIMNFNDNGGNTMNVLGVQRVPLYLLLFVLLTDNIGMSSVESEEETGSPWFDVLAPRNVTALAGKSAYLSCRVRNLGNKTVSWIRHRDLHILTVGGYTYTSDQRFQALFRQETQEWLLHIKWAQGRDAGVYECQVSTQPVASYFVNLHILVPAATILGGPDLHVDRGSTVNLTCTIPHSPLRLDAISWFHQDKVLNPRLATQHTVGETTSSTLLIRRAGPSHSGRYTCSPSEASSATVFVHVLDGERPEAMQTSEANILKSSSVTTIFLCPLLTNIFLQITISTVLTRTIAKNVMYR